jgi:hypothetical protein
MGRPNFLVALLLCFLSACGQKSLIDRQGDALGKFPDGQILRLSGTITEPRFSGEFIWRAMRPGMMRATLSLGPTQIYEEGFDGTISWEKPIGESVAHETTGPARDALRQGMIWLGNYRPLKELRALGAKVAALDPEMLDGVGFDRIQVTLTAGEARTFYLDHTTHLIARIKASRPLHPGLDQTKQDIETVLEDWRKVGGLAVAFKTTERDQATGKILQTIEWKQAEWRPADPAVFAVPK